MRAETPTLPALKGSAKASENGEASRIVGQVLEAGVGDSHRVADTHAELALDADSACSKKDLESGSDHCCTGDTMGTFSHVIRVSLNEATRCKDS